MKGRLLLLITMLLLATMLLLVALLFQACATPGRLPLPSYKIEPAPLGTPASVEALLGRWEGTWGGSLRSILVVEKVEKGRAKCIYSWDKYDGIQAGYIVVEAKIVLWKNFPQIEFWGKSGAKFEFTLISSRLMKGVRILSPRMAEVTMKKVE